MSKDNKWFCPRCKQHREAWKTMEIWKLPPILIVHFNRFKRYNDQLKLNLSSHSKIPIPFIPFPPCFISAARDRDRDQRPTIQSRNKLFPFCFPEILMDRGWKNAKQTCTSRAQISTSQNSCWVRTRQCVTVCMVCRIITGRCRAVITRPSVKIFTTANGISLMIATSLPCLNQASRYRFFWIFYF